MAGSLVIGMMNENEGGMSSSGLATLGAKTMRWSTCPEAFNACKMYSPGGGGGGVSTAASVAGGLKVTARVMESIRPRKKVTTDGVGGDDVPPKRTEIAGISSS